MGRTVGSSRLEEAEPGRWAEAQDTSLGDLGVRCRC